MTSKAATNNSMDKPAVRSALHAGTDTPRPRNAVLVEKLEIKPSEQYRAPLGNYSKDSSPKGFLVELDPEPSPSNAVFTEVTDLGSANHRSFYLDIANFGPQPVQAVVWRI